MYQASVPSRPPLALIASGHEWLVRSFESVLGPHGYAALRAYTGAQARDHARTARPDAIFVDVCLDDLRGIDLCRSLRSDPHLPPGTPILLIASGPATRQARLDALRSGAWEILGLPLDAEEILLKLGTYVTAKLDADRAREESLLDPETGFYNARGLLRRIRELGSDAARNRRALACIVLSPEEAAGEGTDGTDPIGSLVQVLQESCRQSDVVGRLGSSEFVVLAQDTDPSGAADLARRLAAVAEAWNTGGQATSPSSIQIHAGIFAVPDFRDPMIQPIDLLMRAAMALRRSRSEKGHGRIRAFDAGGPVTLG